MDVFGHAAERFFLSDFLVNISMDNPLYEEEIVYHLDQFDLGRLSCIAIGRYAWRPVVDDHGQKFSGDDVQGLLTVTNQLRLSLTSPLFPLQIKVSQTLMMTRTINLIRVYFTTTYSRFQWQLLIKHCLSLNSDSGFTCTDSNPLYLVSLFFQSNLFVPVTHW